MQVMTQQAPVTLKQPSAKIAMGARGDIPFRTEMLWNLGEFRGFLAGQPEGTQTALANIKAHELPMGIVFWNDGLVNPTIGAVKHKQGLRENLRQIGDTFKLDHPAIAGLLTDIHTLIRAKDDASKEQRTLLERTTYQVLGNKVLNLMTGKPFSDPKHELYTPVVQDAMRERIIRLRDSEPLGLNG